MTLLDDHDALLLDLDGTVWEGGYAIPGAVEAINSSKAKAVYVTNNASRAPEKVAEMLRAIDLDANPDQILTSAQAAILMAQEHLKAGDKVLVLGSESFKNLVSEAGYEVVSSAEDDPAVVLHGHSTETGWKQLSEAALAIRKGATYLASNLDTSLPMERGLMVGNGAMVAAITTSTGVAPKSAGKPEPTMFHLASNRVEATHPLAIGDRLDTDIQGGVAAQMPVLHVLTGVSGPQALVEAPQHQRPTYLAADFKDTQQPASELLPQEQGGFSVQLKGDVISVSGGHSDASFMNLLRSVLFCAWQQQETAGLKVEAEGQVATQLMKQWW